MSPLCPSGLASESIAHLLCDRHESVVFWNNLGNPNAYMASFNMPLMIGSTLTALVLILLPSIGFCGRFRFLSAYGLYGCIGTRLCLLWVQPTLVAK